jgi:hypothetical protein
MRCYFLRDGHIAGVEVLPLGLSDEDAIAKAHAVAAKRKGSFEGFEVWDRARFVFRGAPSNTRPNGGWPHPATGPPSGGD